MKRDVYNVLTVITPSQAVKNKVMESIRGYDDLSEPTILDLNKIVPMPEAYYESLCNDEEKAIEAYLTAVNYETPMNDMPKMHFTSFCFLQAKLLGEPCGKYYDGTSVALINTDNFNELVTSGARYVDNLLNFGATTLKKWRILRWGVPTNCYNAEIVNDYDTCDRGIEIKFMTDSKAPHLVIDAIAARFPSCIIMHEWTGDIPGKNCGYAEYSNGTCINKIIFSFHMDKSIAITFSNSILCGVFNRDASIKYMQMPY